MDFWCARVSKMVLSHSNSVKFYRCHGLDLGEISWVRHKTSLVKHYRCGYIEKIVFTVI